MSTARLLFSTGSLHLMDISQNFALAAEAGFDGIEILCDHRWATRDPLYLADMMARYQLPILAVHVPYADRLPGWHNPRNRVEHIGQTLELAETVGAEAIVVHIPTMAFFAHFKTPGMRQFRLPWATPFRAVARWMKTDLSTVQSNTDVRIAFENNPSVGKLFGRKISGNMKQWDGLAGWASSHRWLTLDTTHWATLGVQPLEAYAAAKGQLAHVHLSNFNRGRQHRLPHQGELDLGSFLEQLAADGYEGTISVEVYPEPLEFKHPTALRDNLKACVDFCREHLGS